jgi:hypothetical protein
MVGAQDLVTIHINILSMYNHVYLSLKVKANKGLSILQCSINGEARKWDVKFHIVSRTILG